jgi:outer membrane protein TolC
MKILLIPLCAVITLYAHPINFSTALDITLQNNKELKAKKLNIEEAKESLKEAKSYDFGSLKFEENISRTNHAGYVFGMKLASREANFGDFGFSDFLAPLGAAMMGVPLDGNQVLQTQPDDLNNPKPRTNFETKIVYEIPIFTGYKLQNAKKMAQLQILANQAKYTFDSKKLEIEILKAYNGAVAAKYFIDAIKQAKKATTSFVNFAKELNKEGLVTKIDVKQATVYDMNIDTKMIQAKNNFDLAIAYLRFLTNDKTITDVEDFQIIDDSTYAKDPESYLNRDDYKWMQYNVQTLKHKIDFDSAQEYPEIGAHLEYGFNDNTLNLSKSKDYYLGAVGLRYTIFDGNLKNITKQKAKIKYQQTRLYLDHMENGLKLEIQKNILNLNAKEKIYHQKQKAEALAKDILNKSEELYKNQLISMNTLLMEQAKTQEAQAKTILSKYEYSIASANLKLSMGYSLKD